MEEEEEEEEEEEGGRGEGGKEEVVEEEEEREVEEEREEEEGEEEEKEEREEEEEEEEEGDHLVVMCIVQRSRVHVNHIPYKIRDNASFLSPLLPLSLPTRCLSPAHLGGAGAGAGTCQLLYPRPLLPQRQQDVDQ